MPLTLAIVGRPNVGKSSIFNRLVGRRLAIVHDTPGVTRDRSIAETVFHGLDLRVIDTAGFEGQAGGESLSGRMADQTLTAIGEADALLLVLDGREGLTEADKAIARALRKSGKPVILAANKCEGRTDLGEMHALGFGAPLELSAEHALGFADLAEALAPLAPRVEAPEEEEDKVTEENDEDQEEQDEDYTSRPLRLALVGRPNVGKSSLFNRLLGDERSIVGPEAGLTRDAIAAPWKAGDREILLHDTAGLRKKARVAGEKLEEMSVSSTLEAIRFADCVIVMIDAGQPFEKQDLAIADLIAREGRAIVVAVIKGALKADKPGAISELREKLDRLLPQVTSAAL
ncbi:MAG TPA: ribosome biogenesis GTPase Der, partial [Rhizomicrobium sp.]|nr:ribosome biogenesis GTPase Der [Rhizomicrobium sp.]